MPADIIVYAIIAAGLVFWLRSLLGTRHGDEKERHNPYANPIENSIIEGSFLPEDAVEISPEAAIMDLAKNPSGVVSIENKTAENGLIEIARAEGDFDIKSFMTGAQDAFAIIVESFGEGDRETLKNLLADPVYNAFEGVIKERETAQQSMATQIHAIKKAEIIEAEIKNKTAFITIRFTATETSVLRDKDGNIISGHPDKVTQMRDIWVFARKLRSRDPRWLVQETRGDFEGDNETLPNSDKPASKKK